MNLLRFLTQNDDRIDQYASDLNDVHHWKINRLKYLSIIIIRIL